MSIQTNVPLAPHTTIGVGGFAKWYTICRSTDEVITALEWARSKNLATHILGGGSNSLISDLGFQGLVLHLCSKGIAWTTDHRCIVWAGEAWDDVVKATVEQGCTGIECLSGIPGTTGAAPIQNIGAYGQEVADVIEEVEVLDRRTLQRLTFSQKECLFSYRNSLFKQTDRDHYVVLKVTFRLNPDERPTLKYPELKDECAAFLDSYTPESRIPYLRKIRDAVLKIRSRKGMVTNPNDPDSKSLGSFFTNPILSLEEWALFQKKTNQESFATPPPVYPTGHDHVKLSAAWLIQNSGTKRGETFGGAAVSSKHVLALINQRQASTKDILTLARIITERVQSKFGVTLTQEPDFIGEPCETAEL